MGDVEGGKSQRTFRPLADGMRRSRERRECNVSVHFLPVFRSLESEPDYYYGIPVRCLIFPQKVCGSGNAIVPDYLKLIVLL